MDVLLIAEEAAGSQALRLITQTGHRVAAVVTGTGTPEQPGATVAATAKHLDVETWPADLARDPALAERIRELEVDVLLNVHALHILDAAVLEAPAIGSFNLHPGPLPEYAGLNAPSWAILRGERFHGVTLHWMVAEVDAGPIAYAASCEIGPRDTGLSLSAKCVRLGVPLIGRLLDQAKRDPRGIPREAQDLACRRWFGSGPPFSGRLPWSLPARQIVDLVRAADFVPLRSPWSPPSARLGKWEVSVLKASLTGGPATAPPGTVGNFTESSCFVAALDEWVAVERVRIDGGPPAAGASIPAGRFILEPAEALASSQDGG